jgi:hypothetical protein
MREALMLDNPEKATRLLTALKAAGPFEVEVLPSVIKHLADFDRAPMVIG